jgi:hypothetical protein
MSIHLSNGTSDAVGRLILGNTRECFWERMDKENPNITPELKRPLMQVSVNTA